ncbi:acyl-phosphate:glycerol-3-phosphate O-acyltransferase PlsY [Klebsiella pneumoniae]|uniref:Glycerol-3-phosphate acyltransferase n=1 Tax=Klebsiella pneumoniae TaxID=573 RepID=A0A508ZMI8_KLEPN|nr:acyl-phosphate:glycerol-3-phosphate O-acyltransferase PlsY [Klebsiella pneumoniae]
MSAIAPGLVLLAYLCGSISSAILVCRLAGLPDPRDSGSGNPGATNVLRIGGKGAAVAVLIFDVLKGMLPVWGAWALGLTPFWLGLVAIAACVGHIWPVFFHFRGGKGVATAFGAIAPIGLDLTGVMAGTWLLTILLSGYSSLGAIVSALIAPFYVWVVQTAVYLSGVDALLPDPPAPSRQHSASVASPGEQNLDPREEEKNARAEVISPPGSASRGTLLR